MTPLWLVAVAAAVFGCAATLGIRAGAALCNGVVPFADGPVAGRPPVLALVGGAVAVGAAVAARGEIPHVVLGAMPAGMPQFVVLTAAVFALVACWYSDVRCGIVPDRFTIVPLAIVATLAVFAGDYYHLLSAAAVATPFVIAAIVSHGRGMGWGDVKLVAFGGVLLGFAPTALAVTVACLAAAAFAALRGRRAEPIAFAPYLIGSVAVTIACPGLIP